MITDTVMTDKNSPSDTQAMRDAVRNVHQLSIQQQNDVTVRYVWCYILLINMKGLASTLHIGLCSAVVIYSVLEGHHGSNLIANARVF